MFFLASFMHDCEQQHCGMMSMGRYGIWYYIGCVLIICSLFRLTVILNKKITFEQTFKKLKLSNIFSHVPGDDVESLAEKLYSLQFV